MADVDQTEPSADNSAVPPRGRYDPKATRLAICAVGLVVVVAVVRACTYQAETSPSAAPEAAAAASPAKAPTPKATLPAEASTIFTSYVMASNPCISADRHAGQVIGGDDPVVAYQAVISAKEVCQETASAVGRIEPPKADDAIQVTFQNVLRDCRNAHHILHRAQGKVAKVMDGDGSMSSVAKAQEAMQLGHDGVEYCRFKLAETVRAVGGLAIE